VIWIRKGEFHQALKLSWERCLPLIPIRDRVSLKSLRPTPGSTVKTKLASLSTSSPWSLFTLRYLKIKSVKASCSSMTSHSSNSSSAQWMTLASNPLLPKSITTSLIRAQSHHLHPKLWL
jgi:hypothetical protein